MPGRARVHAGALVSQGAPPNPILLRECALRYHLFLVLFRRLGGAAVPSQLLCASGVSIASLVMTSSRWWSGGWW